MVFPKHQCSGRSRSRGRVADRPCIIRQSRSDHGIERRPGWPGCDNGRTVNPDRAQATLFGLIAGVLVVFGIIGLDRLKIDDPVGAISVHGVIGLFGLLLVPVTNTGSSFSGQLVGAATIFGSVFLPAWWSGTY